MTQEQIEREELEQSMRFAADAARRRKLTIKHRGRIGESQTILTPAQAAAIDAANTRALRGTLVSEAFARPYGRRLCEGFRMMGLD